MIEEQINARLKAVAGVTAIAGERIYPDPLPQRATLPAVTHRRLSGEPEHAMGADVDVSNARFSVSCWAAQYSQAKALAYAVRAALSRHRATAGSDEFLDVLVASEVDDYDPDTRTHQCLVDFDIWYREG